MMTSCVSGAWLARSRMLYFGLIDALSIIGDLNTLSHVEQAFYFV